MTYINSNKDYASFQFSSYHKANKSQSLHRSVLWSPGEEYIEEINVNKCPVFKQCIYVKIEKKRTEHMGKLGKIHCQTLFSSFQ